MIVQIIPEGGVGRKPIVLKAHQVLVTMPDGTPIVIAADYGPENAVDVHCANCKDTAGFNRSLKTLGVDRTVVVDVLRMPGAPKGARLLTGPST